MSIGKLKDRLSHKERVVLCLIVTELFSLMAGKRLHFSRLPPELLGVVQDRQVHSDTVQIHVREQSLMCGAVL
jgi:hypothetical protein